MTDIYSSKAILFHINFPIKGRENNSKAMEINRAAWKEIKQ